MFPPLEIGLYKKDLVHLSLTAADLAGDVLLYKHLTKRRVETILASLKKDYNGCIRALELSLAAERKHELAQGEKGGDAYFIKMIACAPLKIYISKNHYLMGSLPFNKAVLIPLVARWGWEKVSAHLRGRLLVDLPYVKTAAQGIGIFGGDDPQMETNRLWALGKTFDSAYEYDKKGDLKPVKGVSPLSLSYCVSRVSNFFYPSSVRLGGSLKSGLQFLNDTIGLYIPKVCFSKEADVVFDFLGIGFSAQAFDASLSAKWLEYTVQERSTLLLYLREYKELLESPQTPQEKLLKSEQKLRNFVENGHQDTSWFPMSLAQQWKNFRFMGGSTLGRYATTWVVGVSMIKGALNLKKLYNWYFA